VSEDDPQWTILLTIPAGLLRWRPTPHTPPFKWWIMPEDEQTIRDLDDMKKAQNEEWGREHTIVAEYEKAKWTQRLRHLGLIGPPRIPTLPLVYECACSLCASRPLLIPTTKTETTETNDVVPVLPQEGSL